MESKARNIPSGVEPVDLVLGGLQEGQIYLAHGDSTAISLFGSFFLAEGLKRGENVALVINYSPEDVVQRFARINYDCLEDIASGRLIILECAQDIVKQIEGLTELSPVLNELGWLMGEANPNRVVFDPIDRLLFTGPADVTSRVAEFGDWAGGRSSTHVVIPSSECDRKLVNQILPLCAESFEFETEVREGETNQFLRFERSAHAMRMPVEVDPTKGIVTISGGIAGHVFAGDVRDDTGWHQPSQNGTSGIANGFFDNEVQLGERFDFDSDRESLAPPGAARPQIGAAAARLAELLAAAAGEPVVTNTNVPRTVTENGPRVATTAPLVTPAPPEARPTQVNAGKEGPMRDLSDALADQLLEERWMPSKTEPDKAQPDIAESNRPDHGAQAKPDSSRSGAAKGEPHRPSAAEALLQPPFAMSGGARGGYETFSDLEGDFQKIAGQPFHRDPINARDYSVLVISGDASSGKKIVKALDEFRVEQVADGISGLARLISTKPDLVVLELELPIIDGFKVLSHVRASLTMPIIIFSTTRSRASDRMQAADLGADYYVTAPFNSREVRQKARQLIARYRGIDEWLTIPVASTANPAAAASEGWDFDNLFEDIEVAGDDSAPLSPLSSTGSGQQAQQASGQESENGGKRSGPLDTSRVNSISGDQFVPYQRFVETVESRVSASMESGSRFSIVGCRLTSVSLGDNAVRLFSMVSSLIRGNDLMSLSETNDVVVLLTDADAAGARAFITRLYAHVREGINEEPNIWMRSFPPPDEGASQTTH